MSDYRLIDVSKWARYETYRRYTEESSCAISLCDDLDVSSLRYASERAGVSFFIAVLYSVAKVINSHEEFRLLSVDSPMYESPMPAVWDHVDPVYNVFRKETESYSSVFTLWNEDFGIFSSYAREDIERARRSRVPSVPSGDNIFEASCVPWRHFTSVGVECDVYSLSPVVAWGGYREKNGTVTMPVSIQINHASADGFHLSRFLNETEETMEALAGTISSTYMSI